ncbi:kinase-like domain-containing protein [Zopfochytrium polystomum]|nr:kinase-like domain-containing protein [Zopfochytrium polystomum]
MSDGLEGLTINAADVVREPRPIGAGSFGEVYRGVFQRHVPVAIKRLKVAPSHLDPVSRKELLAEARVMKKFKESNVQSPFVVGFFGILVEDNGLGYSLVLEYASLGSLYDFYRSTKDKPVSIHARVSLLDQISTGMAFLHNLNILHHDLKSLNVLLTKSDHNDALIAKITDFGLSRVKNEARTRSAPSNVGGTALYMAPEIANLRISKNKIHKANDVFSFAVLLTEIVSWIGFYGIPSDELDAQKFPQAAAREDYRRNLQDYLNAEVFATVQAGTQLGDLFQSCWAVDYTTRPSFPYIATKTAEILQLTASSHSPVGVSDSVPAPSSTSPRPDKSFRYSESTAVDSSYDSMRMCSYQALPTTKNGAVAPYASDATVAVVDCASINNFSYFVLPKTKNNSGSTQASKQAEELHSAAGSTRPESAIAEFETAPIVKKLIELASDGDSRGQYILALRYHFGLGTAKSVAKAAQWIKLAAENASDSRNIAACHYARLHIAVMVSVGEGFPAGGTLPEGLNLEEMDATVKDSFYTFGYGTTQNADEMIKWLLRSAWLELPDAQFRLGEAYYEGSGVPQNRTEAVNWFRKAAEQGDADGQVWLGKAYYEGNGVPQDHSEAVKWFRKAAEQGKIDGQFWLGRAHYAGNGVQLNWFRRAAEQGDANGQYWLGKAYYEGNGVLQNHSEAVNWFRKSADNGYVDGQFWLGKAYSEGNGVSQNHSEAVNWFRKAAEQGHAGGQYWLGSAYYYANGVQQNYSEAVDWVRKAAEQGNLNGQYMLGKAYNEANGVPQNHSEAVNWFRKAAEQGYLNGQNMLGRAYHAGIGVAQDHSAAVNWFRNQLVSQSS